MSTKARFFTVILLIWLMFPLTAQSSDVGNVEYDLGVFALEEGDLIAAEGYFRSAVEKSPGNPYYHHLLGRTYLKSGRSSEAVGPLETALGITPSISGLQFDLGLAYYESGSYAKAEEQFADLVRKEPGNILARYYLGMCYFKEDRYGRALPPLLRSGEENASIRDNSWYFAGISHYKSGEPEAALSKLDYVAEKAASEKLRASARQWQEAIRTQQSRSARYNVSVKLGLEYDDNVRLDPVNADLGADAGDFVASVYFSGQYKFVNTFRQKAGIGYSHYQTRHFDITEFDLVAGVLSLFYQERLTDNVYVSLRYDPSYYLLDYEEYMQRHQLSPSFLLRLSETSGLRFSYDYTNSNYYADKGRSGQGSRVGTEYFSQFFGDRAELTVGLDYGVYDTDHPDFSRDELRTRVELALRLPEDFRLTLKAETERRHHDNVDSSSAVHRKDDRYGLGFALSRPLHYRWLEWELSYRYTDNESNIDAYSYDKNVTGLSLSAKF